jgi:REP element-mobilizing transposase RayT
MRCRFLLCIYGDVIKPEHVHLLVSEPERATLAEALHFLKLSFTKRLRCGTPESGWFWQKRYYDRNLRDEQEFKEKLRYIHRSPVKRRLVGTARLELEQLSPLRAAIERSRANRVRVDGACSRDESAIRRGEDILDPRLAPKTGARTWATGRKSVASRGGSARPLPSG